MRNRMRKVYGLALVVIGTAIAASPAGATGFDVTDLTGQTQSTWETAIVAILGVVGLFLGAKVAIKWAMRLLAR